MIHMSVAGTSHAKMEIYEVYQQLSCISAHVRSCFGSGQARSGEMPSQADVAKRELVKVLRELAAEYSVSVSLTRESGQCPLTKSKLFL